MAQTIKLKRSGTQNAVPTTSQLALGEVALNTYDGKMYIKKSVGGTESIVEIGGDATSSSGLDFTGNLNLEDNVRIVIGDGNDLQIYHDGSNSIIQESGTGDLKIRAQNLRLQDNDGTNFLYGVYNGRVELFHNNSKKFETTSSGISVTGAVTADTGGASAIPLEIGSSSSTQFTLQRWLTSAHVGSEAYIIAYGASHSSEAGNFAIKNLEANSDIFFELASNVEPLRLTSSGITVTGDISLSGNIVDSDQNEIIEIDTNDIRFNGKHIQSAYGVWIRGENSASNNRKAGIDGSSSGTTLQFYTQSAERMRIDSSGNVGIGTTSPSTTLDVAGSGRFKLAGSTTDVHRVLVESAGDSDYGVYITSAFSSQMGRIGALSTSDGGTDAASIAFENYGQDIAFRTGRDASNAERVRIDSSGNLSIGNTTAGAKLDIRQDSGYAIRAENGSGHYFRVAAGGAIEVGGSAFVDASRNITSGTISSGNITMTGNQLKIISSTDSNLGWMIRDNTYVTDEMDITSTRLGTGNQPTLGLAGQSGINFYVSGTNVGTFNSSGHLLIGKTSTGINTNGIEARTNGLLAASRDQNPALYATRTTDAGDIAQFYSGSTNVGSIGTINSILTIGSGSTGIIFNPNATPNASIYPWNVGTNSASDNAIDLGISTRRWQDLYLAGTIYGGSTLTLDPAAHGDDTGTVVIAGNLQVDGTTTTINSTTLTVDDKNITLASGSTNKAAANGAGLTVDCGSDTDATFTYDGTNDEWDFNKNVKVSGSVGVTNIVTNKVVKFNGSILDDSNIVDDGSTITLGSNTLVTGTTNFNGGVSVNVDSSSTTFGNHEAALRIDNTNTTTNNWAALVFDSNNGASAEVSARFTDHANNYADLYFANRGSGGYTTNMVIKQDGNVGIGTISPSQKLHVVGGGLFSNSVTVGDSTSDALITTGVLKVGLSGGITVIDSSRNLVNIGTISSGAITSSTGTVGTSPNTLKIITSTEANTAQGDVYAALEFHVTGAENNTGTLSDSTVGAIKAIDYRSGTTSFEDAGIGFYTLDSSDSAPVFRGGFSNAGGFFVSDDGVADNNTGQGDIYAVGNISAGNNIVFNNQLRFASDTLIDNQKTFYINTISITDGDFAVIDGNNTGETNIIWRDHSADRLYLGTTTDVVEFRGDVNFQSGHTLSHDGNVILDASRNLTNIGTISSSMIQTTGSRVAIGNTSHTPNSTVDIKTSNPAIRLTDTSGGSRVTLSNDAGTFKINKVGNELVQIFTNGNERFSVETSGAIRFNDAFTFPTTDGSANQVLKTDGSGNVTWATEAAVSANTSISDADGDTKIQVEESSDEDKIRFDIAGTEKVILDSSNFSIESGGFRVDDPGGNYPFRVTQYGYMTSRGASITQLNATGDHANVPLSVLADVNSTRTASYVEIGDIGSAGNRFKIDNSGHVGIGTSSPSSLLHLKDTGDAVLIIEADSDNSTETDNARIELRQDGNNVAGYLYTEGNAGQTATGTLANTTVLESKGAGNDVGIHFATGGRAPAQSGGELAGTVRMTVHGSGGVTIGTTSTTSNGGLLVDNDIKTNSRLGIGSPGNASTPALYNNSDTDTGVYWPAANTLGLVTASTERLRITSTGLVGIGNGATTPTEKLHVFDDVNNSASLTTTGTNTRGGIIKVENDNTTIGSFAALDLRTGSGDARIAAVKAASGDNSADLAFIVDDQSEGVGVERLRIEGETGYIGIGTNSPNVELDLRGNMRLDGSAGTDRQIYFRNQGTGGGSVRSDKNLSLWAGNGSGSLVQYVTIEEGGRVGIGATNPVKYLHLQYSSSATAVSTGDGLSGAADGGGALIQNTNTSGNTFANLDFRARDADGRIAYQYAGATNNGDFHFITDNLGSPRSQFIIRNNGKVEFDQHNTSLNGTANGATLAEFKNYIGTDLNQQKSFLDFIFSDDNSNETPQVRIGAEVGQNGNADSQEKEGSGAFVVYTNNADTTSGDAGASLAERFRVDYAGNVGIGTATPGSRLEVKGTTTDSSAEALNVRDASNNQLFRVRNDGVVVIGDNYLYVSSSAGAYFDGTVRFRNGISDDTGQLSLNSSTSDITFNSCDLESVGNITTSGYLRGPSTFTIDPATHGDDTGTVVIAGNLQVDGTTTTINSTTLTVDDKNITLASGSTNAAAAANAGITVDCGSDADATLLYSDNSDSWNFNKEIRSTAGEFAAYVNTGRYLKYRSSYAATSVADFEIKSDNNSAAVARITGTGTADIFQVYDGTSPVFSVVDGGIVGVGTATPNSTCSLEVYKNGADSVLRIHEDAGTHQARLHLRSGGNDARIQLPSTSTGLEIRTEGNLSSGDAAITVQTNGRTEFGYDVRVKEAGIDTTTTSTAATTQAVIDTFAAATFRSARYTIQVTNGTDSTYHLTEILLIHDGTTPQITEYGTIFTGSAEATFDADISSGNVRLLATPATTDSMTFKVVRHCITV